MNAGTLRVGQLTTPSGDTTVTGNITGLNVGTLSLLSGGNVTESANQTISVTNLAVQATGNVTLTNANSVGAVAANVTGAASSFGFTNAGDLTIGSVDGVSGITTINGTIQGRHQHLGNLTASNAVNVRAPRA